VKSLKEEIAAHKKTIKDRDARIKTLNGKVKQAESASKEKERVLGQEFSKKFEIIMTENQRLNSLISGKDQDIEKYRNTSQRMLDIDNKLSILINENSDLNTRIAQLTDENRQYENKCIEYEEALAK